jgi:hypothetical protein
MLFKDPVFQSFCSKRPIAVMSNLALNRLLDGRVVDEIFEETAEQQYCRSLLFSSMTKLLSTVVMSKSPSVNAAYKKMKAEINVSLTALYRKLDRVEPAITQALVRHSYQQVLEVGNSIGGIRRNDISGYKTLVFDGNWLSGTEHRLKETRDNTAAPLPGKSVVVLDPRFQAIKDYFPLEDGYSQERSALDDLLATVQRRDLWVGDRNFCTLKTIYTMEARGAAFVIRHHKQLRNGKLGKRKRVGRSETGVAYEQPMELPEYEGRQLTVRRIEIELDQPTRKGDTTVVILTNLPAEAADPVKVSEIYRGRWQIESAFQTLTVSLNCEINTLCYPKAALYAFALALVAYNAIALVETAIAAALGREEANQLSSYYIALEIAETTDGMLIALPPESWKIACSITAKKLAKQLCIIAAQVDMEAYRKSKRGPKKKKPPKKNNRDSVHVSSARLLDERKQKSAC